ncbi:hypothetical protein VSDG_03331 [Cytospora chrysosperma]|uniref:Uncharacterized protein n=1 Tax=Cytospora chrysosperma TaxID=252740 RepID=A0A423WB47_CYTCH|nr:hypothetical protein VSDG_03331 [Valsa sordida]
MMLAGNRHARDDDVDELYYLDSGSDDDDDEDSDEKPHPDSITDSESGPDFSSPEYDVDGKVADN